MDFTFTSEQVQLRKKAREFAEREIAPLAEELDAAYQRDQLMMEVLLDIRDLFAQPSAGGTGTGALQTLDALRKLAKR